MKNLKYAAMGLFALGFAGMASAQTKIYITGSSAYRGAVQTAIMKLLGSTDGGVTLPAGSSFGYTGTSGLGSANAAIFKGTFNSTSVIIKTSWSGSGAGVQTVAESAGGFTVGYLPDSSSTTTSGQNGLTDPRAADASPREAVVPQIAFSDVYQGSTQFNGTFLGHTYSQLTDSTVGVVPFVFVKSRGAAASITNMTPQLAQATFLGVGYCPLALYTGLSADRGTKVYATGRDADSGTRITAFAESGVGIFSNVQQYDTSLESGGTPVLYPAKPINGISYEAGEGGEASGGDLANTSHMAKPGLANSYVSYMSTGDAGSLTSNSGGSNLSQAIAYNGVTYSATALAEGQYTFWSYEHIMYKSTLGTTAPAALSFATSLRDQIKNTDATVKISTMGVVRGTDGGIVTADY